MPKPLPDLTVIAADLHELVLRAAAGSQAIMVGAQTPQQRHADLNRLGETLEKINRQSTRLEKARKQHKRALLRQGGEG